MINVTLIGCGNVAVHLYKAFKKAEAITVVEWYARNLNTLQVLKNEVAITDDIAALKEADVYIMAVSDDAITKVSQQFAFTGRLVVHTSGSMSLYNADKRNRRGVFYPLQTFSKAVPIDFKKVPVCLELEQKKDLKIVKAIADAIGSPNYKVNSKQRSALHLAAVFVNNFTNQMYRIGHEITEAEGVDFEILKPLIIETATKIEEVSPYMAQTGPALRGDKKTIAKHQEVLQKELHKEVYELMSNAIKTTHGKKL